MMLRVYLSSAARRWNAPLRRLERSFVTGAQKRALQQNQVAASSKEPTPVAPVAAVSTMTESNQLIPIGIASGLALAAGGGYYYYNNNKAAEVPVKESIESPAKAVPSPPVVAASEAPKAAPSPPSKSSAAIATPKDTPATTATASSGNRVTSITVPDKMKNTTAVAFSTAIEHPTDGNRVTMLVPQPKDAPIPEVVMEDTASTHAAVGALQSATTLAATESLLQSHQSLWATSDAIFMNVDQLEHLSIPQLQARVLQLAAELKDRTRWEAIRLKEFLVMKEKETADKYTDLMHKQRLELEDLMAKQLREQENDFSTRLHQALLEKDSTIQNVLSSALEAQQKEHEDDKKAFEEVITSEIQSSLEEEFSKRLEEYKNQVAKDLQEKLAVMKELSEKLQQLEVALEASKSSKEGSLKAHRLSAAALALAEKLESNQGAAAELAALKWAAGNVGVISTACSTIPASVQTGVPTLSELQTRFLTSVHPKCRQAALVPKGRLGLEGQLAGMLFATLRYPPSFDDTAPESDKDNAEYVLVRAQRHVQLGELEQAVEQLDKLTGQPAFTVADWKKDAIDRINVEKALRVIKLECALLNESCIEEE